MTENLIQKNIKWGPHCTDMQIVQPRQWKNETETGGQMQIYQMVHAAFECNLHDTTQVSLI
jgi:hypothetical protein